MTKRAVTYARVSGDDRDTDGRNLKSQLEMCRDHCQRRGHSIVAELAEDERGASGADFDLPQLTRLLDMAQASEFDVLVVREVDRLSRDQIKAAILRRDLRKCGVEIEYTLYDFPPGAAGDMARQMLEVIAQYQRQDAIIKTARGRRNSVKSGNVSVAGRAPYGYTVVEDKAGDKLLCRRLEVNEPEAAIVRMIFDWYTRGDGQGSPALTMNAITRRLHEMGVPTPSENDPTKQSGTKRMGACEWSRNIVKRLLKSETYAGHWYYGKRRRVKESEIEPHTAELLKARPQAGRRHKPGQKYVIENPREHWLERPVPAIVDCETWQAAQEQIEANRRNAWRPTGGDYLLRHLLTCDKCGASVQCESSKASRGLLRYAYYVCSASRHKLTYARKCAMPGFRSDWVDAEVWKWIKDILTKPGKLQKALDEIEREGERLGAPAKRQLAAIDELIAENMADAEQVAEMGRRKIYKLDKAEAEIAKLADALANLNKRRAKQAAIIAKQIHSVEQVRRVLAFAKEQGPNVERATKRFDVRRGLMEDMDVTASLGLSADGVPEVYAACVVGKKTFRQDVPTTGGPGCGRRRAPS